MLPRGDRHAINKINSTNYELRNVSPNPLSFKSSQSREETETGTSVHLLNSSFHKQSYQYNQYDQADWDS